MSVEKYQLGSQTTVLSTELNSLATNALTAAGAAYDNTAGAAGDGYLLCDLELNLGSTTGGVSYAAQASFSFWFLQTQDGTNYEDGSSSVQPARPPDAVFPVRAVSTAQRLVQRCEMPPGKWQPLVFANSTTATTNASGNTLKVRPVTRQVV